MLRISLIIAIVAGLAAGGVSLWKVREVMVTTMNERNDWKQQHDTQKSEKEKTIAKLKNTESDLKNTKEKLASTEAELKTTTARADELDKQKTELTAVLEKTKTDRDTAQQKLMKWDLIGLQPEQVKGLIAEYKAKTNELAVCVKENKMLIQKRNELQAKLDYFFGGENRPVILPAGLKGKITAVDPKFQFVVLDIGGEQGVLERGELLVNRNGKMMGKLRISNVDKDRSIANILPEWQKGELLEGDQVIAMIYN